MFTGIVEELGTVKAIKRGAHSAQITVGASVVTDGSQIGDSIAVNGVCLTATTISANQFTADVMHETLNRSSLGDLKVGSSVNLERAMQMNGRFGGHIVSGHIDGVGTVLSIKQDDNAVWFKIKAPSEILRYVVEKGSITIEGISLTVAAVTATDFSVSVIPHTRQVTTLGAARVGSKVNLEADIIGKYVEKLMSPAEPQSGGVTMSLLLENGF